MADTKPKERVRVAAGRQGAPLPAVMQKAMPPEQTVDMQAAIAALGSLAKDKDVDPAKMREIFEVQKDIWREIRHVEFDEAFVDLQSELPVINKDGLIEIRAKDSSGERKGPLQQASPFSTFENIMDEIQPLLTKYRFGLSFSTEPAPDGRLLVHGILSRKGHERRTTLSLQADITGSKNNNQGFGSSQSYGKRYGAIALLNIRSRYIKDRDTDGHEGEFKVAKTKHGETLVETTPIEVITEEQAIEIRDLIEWCGVGTPKFCDHFGIAKVSALPANMFDTAKKDCQDYHANQERKRQVADEAARQNKNRGSFR